LHVITDVVRQQRYGHVELAELAIAGGADLVQLRDKQATDDALREEAKAFVHACHNAGVIALINDRVELARQLGASGVHVGASDLPPGEARVRLGSRTLLGATANTLEEAVQRARAPVDYLGVGPVFGTSSKASPAPTLGLDGLRRIVEAVDVPVIAIGNITVDRIADVLSAGAHGVAVLGAVCLASSPRDATLALRHAIDHATSGAT
jgi:thiamine-phosphate pyrophosphorylase